MVCMDKVYSGYYRLYSIAWVLQLFSLKSCSQLVLVRVKEKTPYYFSSILLV